MTAVQLFLPNPQPFFEFSQLPLNVGCFTGNRPDHNRVELDTTVFIAKIGNAAVVSFKGTNPWTLADWMVDWNLYDPADKGKYGRVHPGFRTALGLDKDLMPLPAVRCCL